MTRPHEHGLGIWGETAQDKQEEELTEQYFVTVAPGVDLALIAALCVSFDECMNENNGS